MTDWPQLERRYGTPLVAAVRQRLASGTSPQVDARLFDVFGQPPEKVDELFGDLVAAGELAMSEISVCRCGQPLTDVDVKEAICPRCSLDFEEAGVVPAKTRIHIRSGPPSREIPWLIAIHGFNTVGDWQEEFSWSLSTRFRHRAPVLNFKFPTLRYGVLFARRHAELTDALADRFENALERAVASGIDSRPDIVAHSFGALLFGKLLASPRGANLRFGRVILSGSIVRPDYDWGVHVAEGRIEAVLNLAGRRDFVVDAAQYFIPGSGPSGRIGFMHSAACNVFEPDFEHGSAFEPGAVRSLLAPGGLWDLFLKLPSPGLRDGVAATDGPARWEPANGLLPAVSRGMAIAAPFVLGAVVLAGVLYPWFRS